MQKTLQSLLSAFILTVSLGVAHVASAQLLYAPGKDYTVLDTPISPQKAGQKEVVEFFSYTCPHCYNLEPHIKKWAKETKPADVGFYQVPAVGGKLWTFTARVKYVADKLKLGHEFDTKYFEALHKDKNHRLRGSKDDVIEFMVKEGGVEKAAVEKAWNSLQVKSGLKKSEDLWQKAGLTGVPAVIVNGKYVVQLRDFSTFFKVIDFLLVSTDVEK